MESIEEACLRWPTILWKQSRPDGGRIALQMRQNANDALMDTVTPALTVDNNFSIFFPPVA
jgi:hypothetical protein